MVDNFKFIVSALGGAFVTGVFGLLLQKLRNDGSNESVYADHYIENVDKINALVDERSELKSKNSQLESELKKVKDDLIRQRKVTDQLTIQIGQLKENKSKEEI